MALRRAEAAEEKCVILQSTATAAQSYLRGELQRAKADARVGCSLQCNKAHAHCLQQRFQMNTCRQTSQNFQFL